MKCWIVCVLLCCLLLSGCTTKQYRESDFLGKTSTQIIAEYGDFDCINNHADGDGIYRSTSCAYTITEPRKGFLGTDPEVLIFIVFDHNGIAVRCYEGFRPGG